jgi:phage terminase large subunit-like protein
LVQYNEEQLATLEALIEFQRFNKLYSWVPYPLQQDFANLSGCKHECLFLAGNRCGKTTTGAYIMACHLTGWYPTWWKGIRFRRPIKAWVGGSGGRLVRDVLQTMLLGDLPGGGEWGTGFVPKDLIGRTVAGHGESGLLDSFYVKYAHGGESYCGFKTYDQGREKWQSAGLDVVWVDEEPPDDVYEEASIRLTGGGNMFVTCTPLKGPTEFICRFTEPKDDNAVRTHGFVMMGLDHAMHLTEEAKENILAGSSPALREARRSGTPAMEGGWVWQRTVEDNMRHELRLREVPGYWDLLWGIDFGINHPFAAVLMAWDRDADCIYLLEAFKMADATPLEHTARMKNIAAGVLVAWPHDGNDREKSSGRPLADFYRDMGLRMRPQHATHPDGGYTTTAGIDLMRHYMEIGQFKVAAHLTDWWKEYRTYHYDKNGLLVKKNDDLMSATRQAFMDRRFATKSQSAFGSPFMRKTPEHKPLPGADAEHWGMA